jgi:disulfide bond formation protein DsbB
MQNSSPPAFSATSSPPAAAERARLLPLAGAMTALALATILGALAFEHIGGYQPCPLCLMQRTPYYVGVPLVAGAFVAALVRAPRALLVLLFGGFAALMLYGAGLAAYHAGVEWSFWEGPAACAPSVGVDNATDMLTQLGTTRPPSCTEAVWRFLGLSFAGWNFLISIALAAGGLVAAAATWRERAGGYGSSTASQ